MANMAQLLADRSDPVKQKLAKFRDQCLTVAWWISQHAEDVLLTYFLADTPAAINSSIKRLKNLQKKYYQYRHEGIQKAFEMYRELLKGDEWTAKIAIAEYNALSNSWQELIQHTAEREAELEVLLEGANIERLSQKVTEVSARLAPILKSLDDRLNRLLSFVPEAEKVNVLRTADWPVRKSQLDHARLVEMYNKLVTLGGAPDPSMTLNVHWISSLWKNVRDKFDALNRAGTHPRRSCFKDPGLADKAPPGFGLGADAAPAQRKRDDEETEEEESVDSD